MMKFKIGQKVYWNDPDQNISSGYYNIINIKGEILIISNRHTVAGVYAHELRGCNE